MAERKLNFDAPLLSTRRVLPTAVSVRRKKKLSDDNIKTSECPKVQVCTPDMGLDQITEPASVLFTWERESGRLKCDSFRPETRDSTQDFEGQNAVRAGRDDCETRLWSLMGKKVEESDDDDDDDDFSDALDTLSPKETCSVNHSVSCVSGYGTEMKKPLIVAEDPQTRDFMLNRFLPAAKAMTVEQPQYAPKRQPSPVISEPRKQIRDILPARQTRDIVSSEKCWTLDRHKFIVPPFHDDDEEDDEESEDDEDGISEYANSAYVSKRGCGFLPQLCFRNSLGMLNTVSGLKARPDSLITSSHKQVKSSKVAQLKSRFQSVKKVALDSISKQKSGVRAQSPLHLAATKKLNSESEQLIQKLAIASRSSSPYRRSGSTSPYRSVGNNCSHHNVGFPVTRKEAENLRANRLNKHIKSKSRSQELIYPKSTRQGCSTSPVAEKTVCADTEKSSITSNQENGNVEILPETAKSSPPCVETVSEERDMSGNKPNANLKCGDEPSSTLALPLPKKPSESWLLRNLPSVSSQNPSRRSPFRPQRKNPEDESNGTTKWETVVKSSYIHRDHIRYSEELVAHTRRQSKT